MRLLINQSDGATAASVPGGRPSVVLLAAAFHVLSDARIERAISTSHDVHEPFVAGRSYLRFTVFFRHQDKIPFVCVSGCRSPILLTLLKRKRSESIGGVEKEERIE